MFADIPISVILDFINAYLYNLIIAVLAMLVGCSLGFILGYLANFPNKTSGYLLKIMRSVFCNVPSFVLLFYFTLMVPSQFEWLGESRSIPPLAKAVLALSIPVMGYYSDIFELTLKEQLAFSMAGLKQFFMVILMASTTASVIGVNELMATANTYIALQGETSKVLPVYLIVVAIFLISGLVIQLLFNLMNRIYHKVTGNQKSKEDIDENATINSSAS